jgi:Zn-dependent peptidase ImmA (M78 family)/DNA-binding XRE family transcriptional regulator
MIGQRIKQARKAAGMSMRQLADSAGISAMAISKYESGQLTPSSKTLLALAKALNVRVEYFFRDSQVELEEVDFRKHPKLPEKLKNRVLADAKEQLERWAMLEEHIPAGWAKTFKVPGKLPGKIDTYDQIEDAAQAVRNAWKLGTNPIPDLLDTLESQGIKVLLSKHAGPDEIDGLVASANGQPVIVVGADLPGDRQRFTLAHELGHLVLKGKLSAKLDEERACHRFAGAFLAPREKVLKLLGERRTWLEPQELWLLKQKYGLSMGGWTYRARDLNIINQASMSKLWQHFRECGWKQREPDPQYPSEQPRRFQQLVYRALAEDLLSESKAAELLGLPLMKLHALRNMECPNDAAYQ